MVASQHDTSPLSHGLESCSSRLSKAEEEEDLVGSEGRKDPYAELLAPPNAALSSSESSAKAFITLARVLASNNSVQCTVEVCVCKACLIQM